MHRLRKQKSKTPKDQESDGGILKSAKSFRRGKHPPPPPRPEIDLTAALPPTDDFRTSLLMPNLAQRFSILAAQEATDGNDDPGSTSRKLFANSQFNSASGTGLSDIAETRSISGSISGKQAQFGTEHGDSHGQDEAGQGVMSRPRPGEGNVLFGGRQKIFRVHANRDSSEEVCEGISGSKLGGRTYYDDDVPLSTFQQMRKQQIHYYEEEEEVEVEQGEESLPSPALTEQNIRDTTSSITPTLLTRTSTAATSVTSPHLSSNPSFSPHGSSSPVFAPGPAGKQRRPLYEQALDQQLQEQNLSKLELLASQRRHGATSPPPMRSYSPIGNPHSPYMVKEDAQRSQFYDNEHNQPTPIAAPISGHSKFSFGVNFKSASTAGSAEAASPITSKPVKSGGYDDKQYHLMQQQKLISESASRSRDPSVHRRSASVSSLESVPPTDLHVNDDVSISGISNNSEQTDNLSLPANWRGETESHPRPSGEISSDENDADAYPRRRQDNLNNITEKPALGLGLSQSVSDRIAPLRPMKKESQPASRDSSEGGVVQMMETAQIPEPSRGDRPAFKLSQQRPFPAMSPRLSEELNRKDEDSPTLPTAQGLSVLVRQHLRTDSGRSSIYAASTYTTRSRVSVRQRSPHTSPPRSTEPRKLSSESVTAQPSAASSSSGGNVWEFDDWDGSHNGGDNGQRPESFLSDTHPALRKVGGENDILDKQNKDMANSKKNLLKERWDEEKGEGSGSGNQSSDDDDEDRDWEDELAHRKRLVQQNLKEHASRSNSPIRELAHGPPPKNNGAVSLLRPKTSNNTMNKGIEDGNRGTKFLGMGNDRKEDERRFRRNDGFSMEEEERLRGNLRSPKNIPPQHYPRYPREQGLPPQVRPYLSNQNYPPPQNRPPPQLEDHPAMRPRQYPPNYPPNYPNGAPPYTRSPIREPQLRNSPSREYIRNGARGQDARPRERDDRYLDGPYGPHGPPHRSPNPNSYHPNSHPGTPIEPKIITPRLGPSSPIPRGRPDVQGYGRHPDDRYHPEDRYRDDPRTNGGLPRKPANGDVRRTHRDHSRPRPTDISSPRGIGSPDGIGSPIGSSVFSQENSPPPTARNRSRANSNAISSRQRSESDLRRGATQMLPIQTSPPRIPPPPPPVSAREVDKSPIIGKSPTDTNSPSSSSTPKTIGFPSTPNIDSISPVTPSSSTSTVPTSAHLAKLQNFQNMSTTPVKKRHIDKSLIGGPTLIASTSNIPTVALPIQSPESPSSASSIASRKRRQTTTTIFGGFGKNDKTPGQHRSDDEVGIEVKKEKMRGKLRKSTSDGGGLNARARKDEINIPAVPALPHASKTVSGPFAEGGMI